MTQAIRSDVPDLRVDTCRVPSPRFLDPAEKKRSLLRTLHLAACCISGLAVAAAGQVTERVSVSSTGQEGNSVSYGGVLSGDGRLVAFSTGATNFDPTDMNYRADVYVHDRSTGSTVRASYPLMTGWGNSFPMSLSSDGRYLLFKYSTQPALAWSVLYLCDLQTNVTTTIVGGQWGTDFELYLAGSISPDGRYVAYSIAYTYQVKVFDRLTHSTTTESVNASGSIGNLRSYDPMLSLDGRFVLFSSDATNLVPGDTNGSRDVFIRDRLLGTTERINVTSAGAQSSGGSNGTSISADGCIVAFQSAASDLVPNDLNSLGDAFVHDRGSGATWRVSVDSSGQAGNGESSGPRLSSDGRFVTFSSRAANLVPGDTNGTWDAFLHDLRTGRTTRESVDTSGAQGMGVSPNFPNFQTYATSLSSDGSRVSFGSQFTNLVPGDTNGWPDAFVRDHTPGCPTPVTYCAAATNSSGQAAAMATTGWSSFVANNLDLVCAGLPATATGFFFYGTIPINPGVPFGNGVRCVGGTTHRLGIVHALNGVASQTQDFSTGAYAGIGVGSIRHFEFLFRDPVAGGANFNTSNALTIVFCN